MDKPLKFAPEKKKESEKTGSWKILIVDDDPEIHRMTSFVLKDFRYDRKALAYVNAYSSEEAKKAIAQHPDTAIILLDVVMGEKRSGLEVVRYVRDYLKNEIVRIILRTGEAGQAPEREVITEYDINDYKEKQELTTQKLYTVIISSLRSFQYLKTIDRNRCGLERIIESSRSLLKKQSLHQFSSELLNQLVSILSTSRVSFSQAVGFVANLQSGKWIVTAGIGKFKNRIGLSLDEILSVSGRNKMRKVIAEKKDQFYKQEYFGYFGASEDKKNLLYLKGDFKIDATGRNLLNLFSANVRIAFDNIALNDKVITEHKAKIAMQRGVLVRLNEVIGLRSIETGNHVKRVAEYACVIAQRLKFSDEDIDILNMASPLHDVGKVGIPDAILLKPDKLSQEEYEIIKKHTTIGAKMLHDNKSQLLQVSATIAQYHHEKWNGTGYPFGLTMEDIPLLGRITAICDVFDALISKRCYKEPWSITEAFENIESQKGIGFDPNLVDIFLVSKNKIIAITKKYSAD